MFKCDHIINNNKEVDVEMYHPDPAQKNFLPQLMAMLSVYQAKPHSWEWKGPTTSAQGRTELPAGLAEALEPTSHLIFLLCPILLPSPPFHKGTS